MVGEDGFDACLGAQGLDHRVGQGNPRDGGGAVEGDLDHEVHTRPRARFVIGVGGVGAAQLDERVGAAVVAGVPGVSFGGAHPLHEVVDDGLEEGAVHIGQ